MEEPRDRAPAVGERLTDSEDVPPTHSDPRELAVLQIIQLEHLTQFSFDGLRRRSGLHQETLSRVLDRLEDEGILSKSTQGYNVTGKLDLGHELIFAGASAPVPLLQTLLPDDVELDSVVAALKGRWFGRLRWLGVC